MTHLFEREVGGADPFCAAVLDGLPEAVIVTAADGRIVYVNRAVTTLLGYMADEVVGHPITRLTPRQTERRVDPVKWLRRWAAEPDFEQSRHLDLMARKRDGRQISVEVRVREGLITGEIRYFITVRDNTLRRREHAGLRDANLRAARILMVAEDAIVSIDANQRIQDFNLAAEHMFGYQAPEVVGMPLSILIPKSAREVHETYVEAFGASIKPSHMMSERKPVVGQRRSGETFTLEATITKVSTGSALTYAAHLRDVTQRNLDRDRLRESERRIRAVFDNAMTAIALLTRDGTIVEINRSGTALAEPQEDLVGERLWEGRWLGLDPETADGTAQRLRQAVEKAGAGKAERLFIPLAGDGPVGSVEVGLTPIHEGDDVAYILVEERPRRAM